MAHFRTHLQKEINLKPTTIRNYIKEIKLWRKELEWELTSDKIREVLRHHKNNPSRINNRLAALRSYADYHHMYGDSRLKIILISLNMPNRSSVRKEREIISPERTLFFYYLAQVLTSESKRTGVWIGLILFGFSTTEFANLNSEKTKEGKFVYSVRRGKSIYRSEVPDWLHYAYQKADKKKLERSATTIRDKISKYDINIQKIRNACNYHDDFDWRKYKIR